jgi:hypothetical protein
MTETPEIKIKKTADMKAYKKVYNKDYIKKYYQENKQKFLDADKKRAMTLKRCDVCGIVVAEKYLTKHNNTMKHKKNTENANNSPQKQEGGKMEIINNIKNTSKLIEEYKRIIDIQMKLIESLG